LFVESGFVFTRLLCTEIESQHYLYGLCFYGPEIVSARIEDLEFCREIMCLILKLNQTISLKKVKQQ
jgi:hypothetical protein